MKTLRVRKAKRVKAFHQRSPLLILSGNKVQYDSWLPIHRQCSTRETIWIKNAQTLLGRYSIQVKKIGTWWEHPDLADILQAIQRRGIFVDEFGKPVA